MVTSRLPCSVILNICHKHVNRFFFIVYFNHFYLYLVSFELQNYRPVSNLSFLSKIIETVVLRHLNGYIECNQLFCKMQSAYRRTAIVKVHNDILSKLDDHKNVVLMLFDLSAAFDTIKHGCLMQKLHFQYGITSTALCWFNSYLQSRKYCIEVNDTLSAATNLHMGVPQGSIIGPILFI